jgi:uncharacterized protein
MFIDIHTHVTLRKNVTRPDGTINTTAEELIAMLDEAGIDKAVLLPLISPEHMVQQMTTDDILDITAKYPDRFIPFCNIDPRAITNSPAADFMPLLDYYKSMGCKGIGEMTANLPFDDPRVENLFKQVEKAGIPLLFHIGPQSGECYGLIDDLNLPKLEGALRKFPKLVLIGHSQPFWSEISADNTEQTRNGYPTGPVTPGRIPQLMSKYPNLYCDISAGSGHNALSRDPEFGFRFMEEFQDRLLFGTDICRPGQELPQPGFFREIIAQGKISRAAYEKITWQNANGLLGLGL